MVRWSERPFEQCPVGRWSVGAIDPWSNARWDDRPLERCPVGRWSVEAIDRWSDAQRNNGVGSNPDRTLPGGTMGHSKWDDGTF